MHYKVDVKVGVLVQCNWHTVLEMSAVNIFPKIEKFTVCKVKKLTL